MALAPPTLIEIDMNAEVGAYQEDDLDEPNQPIVEDPEEEV